MFNYNNKVVTLIILVFLLSEQIVIDVNLKMWKLLATKLFFYYQRRFSQSFPNSETKLLQAVVVILSCSVFNQPISIRNFQVL